MVLIPESEMWLLKNEKAFKAVQTGLKQSAEGKLKSRKSMARNADDQIE